MGSSVLYNMLCDMLDCQFDFFVSGPSRQQAAACVVEVINANMWPAGLIGSMQYAAAAVFLGAAWYIRVRWPIVAAT
jgi:hypothetical protein